MSRDQLFADALRRAATRFGGQIVAEKEFKDTGTAQAHRYRRRPDPAADAGLHAGPARPRRRARRRRERGVRHLCALPHLDPAAGRRHGRAGPVGLASGQRAMGRHADPEPLRQGDRPAHAVEGHVGLDGGAHRRRGGHAHATAPTRQKIEALHPLRRFLDRRLQGPEADLPQMELAAAPADLPRRRPRRSSRPRRRRAFCTRSPSSTRSASTSRRPNAF